jgi:signal peptidase II
MMKIVVKIILLLSIGFLNVGCDQLTKAGAKKYLKENETVQVVDNLFVLFLTENGGAFLSMGSKWPLPVKIAFLVVIPLFILLAAAVFVSGSPKVNWFQAIGFAFILGGGISNLWDRIFHNLKVVDFMNFGIGPLNSPLRTGVMNFADLSVLIGAVLIFVSLNEKKDKPAAEKSA